MTDIVERLRTTAKVMAHENGGWCDDPPVILREAADEIERLRKECQDAAKEIYDLNTKLYGRVSA